MDYDMEKSVKFCMVALDTIMHGKVFFLCPLCGGIAYVELNHRHLKVLCHECKKQIEW